MTQKILQSVRGAKVDLERRKEKERKGKAMSLFDWIKGIWVLCLVLVRVALIAALLVIALPALAHADLQVCGNTTLSACTTCSFQGLPSGIAATNVAVSSGACCVDIQSLIGTAGTYTVTFEQCEPVTGTGIPANTQSCSAAGPGLSFSLPTVVILTAPGAPALAVH
jgi:hypothetical protein